MEEELEIILNPLNITGQPPALMLRMRGWRRGWRSYTDTLNITGQLAAPMVRMRGWRRGWRTC
jgi:hypothetical protein